MRLDAARRAVDGETKGLRLEDHRSSLEQAVREAEQDVTIVRRAHRAVERLADRLQNEADEFSNTILRPLNTLIGAFNDALLTTPGTTVAFNADYFKDRTGFTMQVRRKVAGGRTVNRNLNPQLLLSEGQLAANGFSILCSASVSYPWSRWRALLLDNPLQHNDVIHTAAFADVMRNLVSLEGYQVIMSSHDTAETDFIERKFTAAALPCVVVQLLGDSPESVRFETRANTFARSALDGPAERTAS